MSCDFLIHVLFLFLCDCVTDEILLQNVGFLLWLMSIIFQKVEIKSRLSSDSHRVRARSTGRVKAAKGTRGRMRGGARWGRNREGWGSHSREGSEEGMEEPGRRDRGERHK